MTSKSMPPGPTTSRFAQGYRWFRQADTFLEECEKEFGSVFTLRLPEPMGDTVIISDPELIPAVFTTDADVARSGETHVNVEPLLGDNSLLLLDGKRHLNERRIMWPPFRANHVQRYAQVMEEVTLAEIANWPVGEPFPVRLAMVEIALSVMIKTIFGINRHDRKEELRAALTQVLDAAARQFTRFPLFRGRANRQRGSANDSDLADRLAALDSLILAEIAQRRADGSAQRSDDVLSLLMEARYEDGIALTDLQIRDEMVTLLVAGHDTTATALAWTFELLFRNPQIRQKLERRIADGQDDYLEATIKESLRMRPVFYIVPRKLSSTIELGSYRISSGAIVAPCLYLVHRRADLFESPMSFQPERFLNDETPERLMWIPFGGGRRRCIGARFAFLEMKTVVRCTLANTRLAPAQPDPEPPVRRATTFMPSQGTLAIMEGRRASSPLPQRLADRQPVEII
jgi:cytochrome P450